MARSKKKSLAQKVVGTAAIGLPEPARRAVASRVGAPIAFVLAVLLIGSGVVTVHWTNGRPDLELDRKRAREVREDLQERAEAAGVVQHDSSPGSKIRGVLEHVTTSDGHWQQGDQKLHLDRWGPVHAAAPQGPLIPQSDSTKEESDGQISRVLKYLHLKR